MGDHPQWYFEVRRLRLHHLPAHAQPAQLVHREQGLGHRGIPRDPGVRRVAEDLERRKAEREAALANALAPIPDNSIIMRMALDWRRYYGDAKACASAQDR